MSLLGKDGINSPIEPDNLGKERILITSSQLKPEVARPRQHTRHATYLTTQKNATVAADDIDAEEGDEKESSEEDVVLGSEDALLMYEDYGLLPSSHPVVQFVRKRLKQLAPEVPEQELPAVQVLASKGEGVNAAAFANNTILITPELLAFIETTEELDGVLLHEAEHLWQKHLKMRKKKENFSVTRAIGVARHQEYDADMRAFYDAADARRKTSPLGIIRFLERLREQERKAEKKTGTMSWGIVHGETTDRILNLKSALRLLDLLDVGQNEHSLTPLDSTIANSLHGIPAGGNTMRLLQAPPTEVRYWSSWLDEMRRILSNADWKLLQVVMSDMAKKIEQLEVETKQAEEQQLRGTAQKKADHMQSYTMLLQSALQRWNELFEKRYSHLEEEQKEKMRAFLLETAAELPVASESDKPLWKKLRLGKVTATAKAWKDEEGYLTEIQACLENVASPIRRGQTFGFIAKAAAHSIGPAAAFDDDEGVRAADFLSRVAELIKIGRQVDQYKGVGAPRNTAMTADSAWHESIASTLVTLADQNTLNSDFAEVIRDIASRYSLPKNFPMKRSMELVAAWKETGEQVAQALQSFFDENTSLITDTHIDLREGIGRLCQIYVDIQTPRESNIDVTEIFEKARKAVESGDPKHVTSADSKMTEEGKVLKEFQGYLQRQRLRLDYTQEPVRSAMVELCQILRNLPQHIPGDLVADQWPYIVPEGSPALRGSIQEEMIRQFFSLQEPDRTAPKPTGGEDEEVEYEYRKKQYIFYGNWRDAIPWAYASACEPTEYERLVTEFADPRSFGSYEELMECLELANRPNSNFLQRESPINFTPDFLANDGEWQALALILFSKHIQSIENEAEFFDTLGKFIAKWPVSQALTLSTSRSRIIEAGLKFVDLKQAATNPLLRERLLQLSFFVTDTTIRKPLQDYLTQEDVSASDFQEAMTAIFDRHQRQSSIESATSLDYLIEEKARKPEEIEKLRDRCLNVVSAQMSANRLGKSVIFDTLMQTIFRRSDRGEIFRALLSSNSDETLLRERLESGWYLRYNETIDSVPDNAAHCESPSSLVEFVGNKPDANAEGIIDAEGIVGREEMVSLETIRRSLYRLGSPERHVLLRKLMSGQQGVLATEGRREEMLDDFFRVYVHTEGDETLTRVLKQVFGSFVQAAPSDELFIMLEPLLRPRIAIPPSNPTNWHPHATKRALDGVTGYSPHGFVDAVSKDREGFDALKLQEPFSWEYEGEEYEQLSQSQQLLLPAVDDHIRFLMDPSDGNGTTRAAASIEAISSVIPSRFFYQEAKALEPIELVLDVARQLGAPGVRFLQLLGQTVDIPEQYRSKFLEVYDSLRGQSKLAAWETVRRDAPSFAPHVHEFKRRIGGGSLYTVYDTETDDSDSPREVTKVMNPNALYHAQFSLKVMRDALAKLAEEHDGHYQQAVPLLDVIEEWIVSELNDVNFEENDIAFRKKWQGWKPNRSFQTRIQIPTSKPTGTVKVRRDEYAEGKNFTLMNEFDPREKKEVVALAVQHYIGQLGGTMDYLLKEKVLVHSDISVGNLRYNPEKKQLSILDRAMYLEFSREDRSFLKELADVGDVSGIAHKIVDWLWVSPENQEVVSSLRKEDVVRAILERVQARGSDQETAAIDAMVAVHENGLRVPLRFMLLFKNFNALRQMALQAGFSSLKEAAQYKP
jgi:hypothetical protein